MTDGTELIKKVQELTRDLAGVRTVEALYRWAVQGLLNPLGFDRAALFLYDPISNEMRGTWGTDDHGRVVDESGYHSRLADYNEFLKEALKTPDRIKVWEDRELTLWDKPVGRGWNAMVVLMDADRILGWLSVDNAFRHQPLTALQREVLSLYGRTLGALIQARQFAELSEKYRTQNELKDRLFTILAHDLRGPIGNLSVTLGFACDQPMDPEDLKEVLREGRKAALQTYNLLENVLGWIRSQISEIAALRERVPLIRALVAVQVWLEATAKAKDLRLVVDCHESLSVVTDERMLETIVRNLVSNAIKFSPPGRPIVLRGREDHGNVVIEVIDQGIGMPPEKLVRLFDHDQKKSQPGTAGEPGSGLGLQFSADLARTLGGRLEAESSPGQGSTFRLILHDEIDGDL